MKVAHFAEMSECTGLYESVKELIQAERSVGIDAQFVDFGHDNKPDSRIGMKDDYIETVSPESVLDSDLIVRHSDVPKIIKDSGIPLVLSIHGRPENSFLLEYYKGAPIISLISQIKNDARYKGLITYWPEYIFHWQVLSGKKVFYVPPPVDYEKYTPNGIRHSFSEKSGVPNIVIADAWREDSTPFNLLLAAKFFKDTYCRSAKVHIYGIDTKRRIGFINQLRDVMGEAAPQILNLDQVYRNADIVLSSHGIATRVVREALSSGCAVVAGSGNKHTPYSADPRDPEAYANQINECWEHFKKSGKVTTAHLARNYAIGQFGKENVGKRISEVYEKIISKKSIDIEWNDMSITESDWSVLQPMLDQRGIRRMVEFGCGVSTQLFDREGIRVHSYETLDAMIDRVENQTTHAVIKKWDGKTPPVIKGDFQAAFIDGPKYGKNREPSYQAVANSEIPFIICHDTGREEDLVWVKKYFNDYLFVGRNASSGSPGMLFLKRPDGPTDKLTYNEVTKVGPKYCDLINTSEQNTRNTKKDLRRNERPIEYGFVFDQLRKYPFETALDVGTGQSVLPSLLLRSGLRVKAIDNVDDFWPQGMHNRHFFVEKDDITDTKIDHKFDLITCVSMLEHVGKYDKAVENMLSLLNPGGKLVLTFPYNECGFIENVYDLPDVLWRFSYPCHVYSREQLDKWFGGKATIIDQEYWQTFTGDYWAHGKAVYPPVKVRKEDLHQLTCLVVGGV